MVVLVVCMAPLMAGLGGPRHRRWVPGGAAQPLLEKKWGRGVNSAASTPEIQTLFATARGRIATSEGRGLADAGSRVGAGVSAANDLSISLPFHSTTNRRPAPATAEHGHAATRGAAVRARHGHPAPVRHRWRDDPSF